MERLLQPTERDTLSSMLKTANASKHIEFECKLFGARQAGASSLDKPLLDKLVSKLKSAGLRMTTQTYLNISTTDRFRIAVEGAERVQGLLQSGILTGVPHTVTEKRPWAQHVLKERGPEAAEGLVDSLTLAQLDAKFTLRAELPYERAYDGVPDGSSLRMLQRYSFSSDSNPMRIDVTLVRQLDRVAAGKPLNAVLAQPIRYELEAEYLQSSTGLPEDALETNLKHMLDTLETVFQTVQGSSYVLGDREVAQYQRKFQSMQVTLVDPVTLMLENVPTIASGYTVTEKADGDRALLYVADDGRVLRLDKNMNVVWTGLEAANAAVESGTVLDGEFMPKLNAYKIFDCLQWRGKDVTKLPLMVEDMESTEPHKYRLGLCHTFADKVLMKSDLRFPVPSIGVKGFVMADGADMWSACAKILDTDFGYEIDGLVFTPAEEGLGQKGMISKRSWGRQFKWKPSNMNSIDFMVRVPQPMTREVHGGVLSGLVHLMVGKGSDDFVYPCLQLTGEFVPPTDKQDKGRANPGARTYVPSPFLPSDPFMPDAYECWIELGPDGCMYTQDPKERITNGMVVEFSYDLSGAAWKPMRIRHDKTAARSFGNDVKVAESIWKNIHNPVTEHMIRTGAGVDAIEPDSYYNSIDRKDRVLKAMHEFHTRIVKRDLYDRYAKKAETLLELACGRAGDINNWLAAGVKKVVGIDNNAPNLENSQGGACLRILQARKEGRNPPTALFVHADAGKNLLEPEEAGLSDRGREYLRILNGRAVPPTDYLDKFRAGFAKGFEVISIQFALHYFLESEATFDVFLNNLKALSKPNTVFMGTIMDGAAVYAELLAQPELTLLGPDGQPVVMLKRNYDPALQPWSAQGDATNLGMAIDVWLESFAKPATEYLVPFGYLTSKLKSTGFDLIESHLFRDVFPDKQDKMSSVERQYSHLHRTFVFRWVPEEEPTKKPRRKKIEKPKEAEVESKELPAKAIAEVTAAAAVDPSGAELDAAPKPKRKTIRKKAEVAVVVKESKDGPTPESTS